MREDGFLRAPIRGDHQVRLRNLQIGEAALAGDPDPAAPFPQTLEIDFDVDAAVSEVQIAPLWEGMLRFVPDSVVNHPAAPADVTEAQFPTWAVVGDLILRSYLSFLGPSELEGAFATHIPFVSPAPTTVRYAKVSLTREFLFTTLRNLPKHRLMFAAAVVPTNDPLYHQKLVIKFLAGQASVPCPIDPATPANDAALRPMPSVHLAAAGLTTTLRVAIASLSEELLEPTWFDARPEYDAIAGDPLVRPPLNTLANQLSSPAHPSHSAVPARVIYQSAAAAAFAPDHGPTTPVRAALAAARADGRTYRRIELLRPPIPGAPVGSAAQRPYPMYRLCWRPAAPGAAESTRIPLSGRLYLPLSDGTYTFWVIPRSGDPAVTLAGDHIRLSTQAPPPARYIEPPSTTLDVALGAASSARLFTHTHPYDSRMVWEGFRIVSRSRARQVAAARAWGLPEADKDPHGALDWFITNAARADYRELYGYIRESAGRHGLAPEFLQVVFFGEGGHIAITPGFDAAKAIDTYGFAGLDLVLYRTGRLPIGADPVPPQAVASGDADEIAEYSFNLVNEGYVDAATAAAVTPAGRTVVNEIGRTIHVGTVTGWKAAIELVAAELHARLDEMTTYLAGKIPPIAVVEENQRRFLAYLRYSSRPGTARGHADNLAGRLRRWTGAYPPLGVRSDPLPHFLSIQRVAVTQWQEAAAVYRSIVK